MTLALQKKECLLELIDVLEEPEAVDVLLPIERVLQATLTCVARNLFRPFANKSKTLSYSEILENKKTAL
jgi:hypothetical protein